MYIEELDFLGELDIKALDKTFFLSFQVAQVLNIVASYHN